MKRLALPFVVISRIAAADPAPAPEPRDQNIALQYSIGGTAISLGLLLGGALAYKQGVIDERSWDVVAGTGLVGLTLLPSAGHWYAHDFPSTGLWIRAGAWAGALGLTLVVQNLRCTYSGDTAPNGHYYCDHPEEIDVMILGATALVTGVVWDMVTARGAARDCNRDRHLDIAPMPLSGGGAGLALAGTF